MITENDGTLPPGHLLAPGLNRFAVTISGSDTVGLIPPGSRAACDGTWIDAMQLAATLLAAAQYASARVGADDDTREEVWLQSLLRADANLHRAMGNPESWALATRLTPPESDPRDDDPPPPEDHP